MMINVDRSSPIPLHYQLKQILIEKIEQGEWKPNDLIPSEQELQDTYGLSRTTVRQALGEMVFEGRLTRERGRGTFVAPPKMAHSPREHMGLTDYLLEQGIQPGWQIISTDWVTASKDVSRALGIDPGSKVLRIRRIRLAAEEPIGHHVAYLPEIVATDIKIDEAALTEGGSLNYIAHIPEMNNSHAERSIEAVSANSEDVELLHMDEGCPVLMITRIAISASGHPVEYMQARYRGDRFKYQISD